MYLKKTAMYCYLLFYFIIASNLVAQLEPVWNKTFSKEDGLESIDIKQTNDDGYIILGNISSTPKDILLIKVDSLGNKSWEKTITSGYADYANGIEVLANGGFAIFGTMDTLGNIEGTHGWLIVTDSQGNSVWSKNYVTHGHIVFQNDDNSFLLIGEKIQDHKNYLWVAKTDSLGEVDWEREFESPILDSLKISAVKSEAWQNDYTILLRGKNPWGDSYLIQINEYGDKKWDKLYENIYGGDIVEANKVVYSDSGVVMVGFDYNAGLHLAYFRINYSGQIQYTKFHNVNKQNEWHSANGKSMVRTSEGGYLVTGYVENYGGTPIPFIGKINNVCDSVDYRLLFDSNTFGYGSNIILAHDGGVLVTGVIDGDIFLSKLSAKPIAEIVVDPNWYDENWDGLCTGNLDASLSYNINGYAITDYEWKYKGEVVGTNSSLEIELPIGDNIIELKITDENGASGSLEDTVKVCSYKLETGGAITSSISTIGDSIFFASSLDDKVYCFNNKNTLKWNLSIGGDVQSTTTIGPNNNIYVGSDDTRLYCFDPKGNFKWDTPMGGVVSASPAITQERVVYVGTENNRLYSVNGDNGSINWNYLTGSPITSSVSLSKAGDIYFGSSDKKFYSLNASGNLNWSYSTGGEIHSSPAIDTLGRLYFGSNDNKLYSLNSNGTLAWAFSTDGAVKSSPVIDSEGNIYFGSGDKNFYCVNEAGSEVWSFEADSPVNGNPSLTVDGRVLFGCDDGTIYSLTMDGELIWNYKTENSVVSAPLTTENGKIYVGSSDNSIYGFIDPTASKGNSKHFWPTFQNDMKRTGSQIEIITSAKKLYNKNGLPREIALSQNYPNPFNPTTKIEFQITELANVELKIYSVTGEKIRTLVNSEKTAGFYSVDWKGLNDNQSEVGSGIYIYQLKVIGEKKSFIKSNKMIKLK